MPHPGELLALLSATAPSAGVAVSASPFTYVAPDNGTVVLRGGLVSTVEIGRSGSFTTTGILNGAVSVSKGDQLRVTYATWWPAMTFFKG
jgi:hypothetical protein